MKKLSLNKKSLTDTKLYIKKVVSFSKQMNDDIKAFCIHNNIGNQSELIRIAVSKHIYKDFKHTKLKKQTVSVKTGTLVLEFKNEQ